MDIVDTWYQLLEIFASCFFLQSLVLDDKVEKFSIGNEFHYQVELFLSLDYFINLHHVWMVKLFENLYLSTDSLNILFILNPGLFQHFNSYL